MKERRYDVEVEARKAYVFWLDSPGLLLTVKPSWRDWRGNPKMESQANGALMRISPFREYSVQTVTLRQPRSSRRWMLRLTHPHPICLQANALFAMSIAQSISRLKSPQEIYEDIKRWATEMNVEKPLMMAILDALHAPPADR